MTGFLDITYRFGLWTVDALLFPYRIGEECADQTSPMRDLGANVAPRPERPAESQTHKSRRGLGESRYRGTLGILERPWDNPPAGRVTGELTALVGARVMGEHRHPALVEQFTVLEGAL
jgi:hypothetical protein